MGESDPLDAEQTDSPLDIPGLGAASGLMRPLDNTSVVDRIVDRLIMAIMNRELLPGQKIPTEKELCESLRVGRNSVREAIKVMVAMGVLKIRRSEGTFVTEGFSERMLDPMVYGLILAGGDSLAVVELRQLFETGILRLAIAKRTEEDLATLRQAFEKMQRTMLDNPTEQSLLEEDLKFHRILTSIVRNPLVDKISVVIERLTLPSRAVVTRSFIERGELDALLRRHADVIRILEERDVAGVSRVIDEHFSNWRSVSARLKPAGGRGGKTAVADERRTDNDGE